MPDAQTIHEQTGWVEPLSVALAELVDSHKAKGFKRISSQSNWVSRLGSPCDLQLTFWRVKPEFAALHDVGLQYIFDEGKLQEDAVLRLLEDMGVRVLERSVSVGNDTLLRQFNVSGQLDAVLNFEKIAENMPVVEGIDWHRKRVVAEVKSVSPWLFDSLTDYDSIATHKKPFVRNWGSQVMLYLLGHSDEGGLLILKQKSTGRLKFVPIILDLDECDVLLNKAKRVNAAVAEYARSQTLPDPIEWRQDLCASCPFLAACPNSRILPQVELSTDAELIELLQRRESLAESNSEYREVNDAIDQKLEPFEGKDTLAGDYRIAWKQVTRSEKLTPASTFWTKRILKLPSAIKD